MIKQGPKTSKKNNGKKPLIYTPRYMHRDKGNTAADSRNWTAVVLKVFESV
jgi:hypothetical protein